MVGSFRVLRESSPEPFANREIFIVRVQSEPRFNPSCLELSSRQQKRVSESAFDGYR